MQMQLNVTEPIFSPNCHDLHRISEHKRNGDNGDVQVVLVRKMKKSWEGLGLRWENVN